MEIASDELYEVAARLEEDGHGDLSEQYRLRAVKAEALRNYAVSVGWCASAESPEVRGLVILNKLIEDGWTPPEGLF